MDSLEVYKLVLMSKQRDQIAFGKLYNIFCQPIHRFISIKIRTAEQSEDILQETFLKAWRYLPKFDEQQLYFGAWLYRISRNLINDHYRRMYSHPVLENIDDHEDLFPEIKLEDRMDVTLAFEKVQLFFPKLKSDYQRVLDLRFIKEYSVKETAEISSKTCLSVRVTQHRAIKKLFTLTQQVPDRALVPASLKN